MKIQYFEDLQRTKFLSYLEIVSVVNRVTYECSERRKSKKLRLTLSEKSVLSWYMREYLYLPFSVIANSVGWAKSANCRESVVRTTRRIKEKSGNTVYDSPKAEVLEIIIEICENEYDCGYGPCLSHMVMLEDAEHALYLAAKSCGYSDRRSSPGCASTPKESQLLIFDELLTTIMQEHTSEQVYQLVEEYKIKRQ